MSIPSSKKQAKEKAKSIIITSNSKLFTWEDLKKDGKKVMELNFQNADYYGQVDEKQSSEAEEQAVIRKGKGVLKYHSGRVYEGMWDNDLRNGEGYERFENGN